MDEPGAPTPHYRRLKDDVRTRVSSGEWRPGDRVPSENEFVERLGISRMTVNRALRELEVEGTIVRIRGKGSFVAAAGKRSSEFQSIPNIADEIAGRGGRHGARTVLLRAEACGPDRALAFGLPAGARLFHSVIVHEEDGLPIQIEDRWIDPRAAPGYLDQDFAAATPNAYLSAAAPIRRAEQIIEAVRARPEERVLLRIDEQEPCLLVRRRTWSDTGLVSDVTLLYPGSRYRLESR